MEGDLYWSNKCIHCQKLMAYVREYHNSLTYILEVICLDDLKYNEFPREVKSVPHLQLKTGQAILGEDILPWIINKINNLQSASYEENNVNKNKIEELKVKGINPKGLNAKLDTQYNTSNKIGLPDLPTIPSMPQLGSNMSIGQNSKNNNSTMDQSSIQESNAMGDIGYFASLGNNSGTGSLDDIYKPITNNEQVVENDLSKDDFEKKYQQLLAARKMS